jgi:hypothetical protein
MGFSDSTGKDAETEAEGMERADTDHQQVVQWNSAHLTVLLEAVVTSVDDKPLTSDGVFDSDSEAGS